MSNFDLRKFEAVIFDLDSTLTNTNRYPIVAINWLLEKSGIESEEFRNSVVRDIFGRYISSIRNIVEGAPFRPAFDIVYTAIETSLEDVEQPADPNLLNEATERFKTLHLELSEVQDGVVGILENLKMRGIKLGVLTNSFAGNAKTILSNLELIHFFSSIVDCGTVNAFKPMKEPFQKVLRDLDTEVSKALYIGDEYYADMVGAKSVGMTTVWINTRRRSLQDQVAKYGSSTTPDLVLNSIVEFNEHL